MNNPYDFIVSVGATDVQIVVDDYGSIVITTMTPRPSSSFTSHPTKAQIECFRDALNDAVKESDRIDEKARNAFEATLEVTLSLQQIEKMLDDFSQRHLGTSLDNVKAYLRKLEGKVTV